ncbi:hypothetical protein Pmani_007679 [Petrolisthes manimaculis]|uniref:MADF domain-containing protein n=1 Tax=Petrolisthes manimaculis TaxID=1843537 RepID=A0AAE1Q7W1_9EUCA|nr:hypothetical protein Pmani_007679 [Petrolisthes manimaculis]
MEPDQRTKSLKRKFGPSTSKCSVEVYPSVVTKKTKLSEHRSIHQLPESAKEVIDSDSFEFIEVTKHYSDYDMLEKERMKVKVEDCSDHNMLEEERMKVEIEDCSDEKLEEEWIKVKVEDCSDEDVIVKVEHDIDEDDKSERANKFVSDKNKNLYGTGCGPPSPDIKPDEPEPNPNYNDTDNWLKVCPSHGHSRQCLQPALQCLLKIPSTANKLNVQWSREAELLLIEKVRCTECLWDHRDAMFLKKTFKRHQYERIASQIEEEFPTLQGLSADAVMHKWAMLKKTFIRELGKVKQPKNSSETTSKWHLFEVLLFLTNTTSAGPSICNFSEQTASKSNFQSIPESLEENEVINGTSLVYSGTEECNGTAKLHDTSSEGFSPLPEVSSCSPRASGGKEQQSSGKNDGATPSKDLHPSSAPKKRRLQSNSETATPSTDKAIALLEGAVHRSKERNSQAFGLYQIIDEHFKKISAKKQLILTAKIVNSLLEDDTQYEND